MILPIRHRALQNKENGFTLVEVIISALLFAIAAVGIVQMVSYSRPKAVVSEHEIGASLYAQDLLARLRGYVDASTYDSGNLAIGNYSEIFGIYTANWAITNDTLTGGRLVNLIVTWTELN